jgi:hypothetical protein
MILSVLVPPGRIPPRPTPTLTRLRSAIRMSTSPPTARELLDRLDARHEELIEKLDELNAQIEAALAEFARSREQSGGEEVVRKAA